MRDERRKIQVRPHEFFVRRGVTFRLPATSKDAYGESTGPLYRVRDAPSYADMRRFDGNMGAACEAAMELK
jgi:hypothetical protein